jgi:hypothetical protein
VKLTEQRRKGLFITGLLLLLMGTAAFVLENSLWRNQWSVPAYRAVAIWHESGMLIAFFSFVLLLFGTGWKRWILSLFAVIQLDFWFSGLAYLVQMT